MANPDDDYTELETRRRASLRRLAVFGLVVVGGLLLYKCANQVQLFGVTSSKATPELSLVIERDGTVSAPTCTRLAIEDCVAQAKLLARNGAGSSEIVIHVKPGAPAAQVRALEELIRSFELVPIVR